MSGVPRPLRRQCLLVLPLRAGHWDAAVDAAVAVLGQPRPEARPQDQDDEVGGRGALNDILEVPGGEHRLVLPEHGREVEEAGELALEPRDDQGRAAAFLHDVARRRDEDAQRLRHGAHLSSMPT
jgi:hypothetical protein